VTSVTFFAATRLGNTRWAEAAVFLYNSFAEGTTGRVIAQSKRIQIPMDRVPRRMTVPIQHLFLENVRLSPGNYSVGLRYSSLNDGTSWIIMAATTDCASM
jgi:hypothetical protein